MVGPIHVPDTSTDAPSRSGHSFARIRVDAPARVPKPDPLGGEPRGPYPEAIPGDERRPAGEPEGSTLPYRQAAELVECLRIMGDENAAFCREVVLSEQPTARQPPPPTCTPTPLPRDRYLAQQGTSTNDFGLTRLQGTVTIPAVHTTRARGGHVLSPTHAALPPITSVFTAAGTFTEGTSIFVAQSGAECASGRYPLRWMITRDGAAKIKEGELEHCADFEHAFRISLERYADTVNGLAQTGRRFPSQRAAQAHVTRLVGPAPSDWGTVFQCLARKTVLRDGARGAPGSHTPRPRVIPPRLRSSCAFATALVTGGSLPSVGTILSSQIIRGCGEGGATTGRRP